MDDIHMLHPIKNYARGGNASLLAAQRILFSQAEKA